MKTISVKHPIFGHTEVKIQTLTRAPTTTQLVEAFPCDIHSNM